MALYSKLWMVYSRAEMSFITMKRWFIAEMDGLSHWADEFLSCRSFQYVTLSSWSVTILRLHIEMKMNYKVIHFR